MEYIDFMYKEFVLFVGKEFVCSKPLILSSVNLKEYVINDILPAYI